MSISKEPNIHPVMPEPTQTPYSEIPDYPTMPDPVSQEEINKTISLDSTGVGTRRGAADSFVGKLKASSVSIPAAILDTIVILALSILFLVGMLVATDTTLQTIVISVTTDLMTQVSAAMLLLAVLQIYVVLSRSFFGSTLGEWTFDCQMGDDDDIEQSYYPFQVVWRSLLMIGTGLVVLPILSLLSRRDLAAYLTGLQLYKKV